jgi:hypothetical protein
MPPATPEHSLHWIACAMIPYPVRSPMIPKITIAPTLLPQPPARRSISGPLFALTFPMPASSPSNEASAGLRCRLLKDLAGSAQGKVCFAADPEGGA